ncbi:hypothetical protein K432DRAFT_295984 [Lepidopterella palustris CBS 459.81]|uniref:Uncharacterized protein n=1 Tax=Lepidopterella palustris CBS 459.81 TaxID=1314670 RepID=A0A8E2JG41_9PEZI|nr:hypothetical protein K432DRAFT_295984 [Lepidopterella palustris CBS 459.81]
MILLKRQQVQDCYEDINNDVVCYTDGGFWYSTTGEIVKWAILAAIFLFFMTWFVGGYMHAKRRMRKGLPLLAYHRWLVPYRERQRFGQVPQNHFTFYAAQPYRPNADGTYPEPPPLYNNDAPPSYMPPPGATKVNPTQSAMEMRPHVGLPPQHTGGPGPAGQETGVVGSGQRSDEENQSADLPPRPQRAKLAVGNLFGRMRK